jgi:hypothetical protein
MTSGRAGCHPGGSVCAMAFVSSTDLLVLHSLRIQGMADTGRVARRFSLDPGTVEDLLLDYQAYGWIQRVEFADLHGWSLTETGHRKGSELLAGELTEAGATAAVTQAHTGFLALNPRFLTAITKWQIRPTPSEPMATNDHSDWPWDEDVLRTLAALTRLVRPIADGLSLALDRFAGYPDRMVAALARVDRGERNWVDAPRIDSVHTVWFELHEDLLATLGLERGHQS